MNFFARCEIIDYSLLVGIHQKSLHLPELKVNPATNNSQYINTEQSEYNSPMT